MSSWRTTFSAAPSMVFTNVITPRSHVNRKSEYQQTLVKRGASLGANSTIVCAHHGGPVRVCRSWSRRYSRHSGSRARRRRAGAANRLGVPLRRALARFKRRRRVPRVRRELFDRSRSRNRSSESSDTGASSRRAQSRRERGKRLSFGSYPSALSSRIDTRS